MQKKYKVQIVNKSNNPTPELATIGSSGYDLQADLSSSKHDRIFIRRGARDVIPTGIFLAMPIGLEAQIRPRSGNALKRGFTVLNTPGTIDADYRGEIGVILINHSDDTIAIKDGDKIAQMIFAEVAHPVFSVIGRLEDTDRGADGFGSTDKADEKPESAA